MENVGAFLPSPTCEIDSVAEEEEEQLHSRQGLSLLPSPVHDLLHAAVICLKDVNESSHRTRLSFVTASHSVGIPRCCIYFCFDLLCQNGGKKRTKHQFDLSQLCELCVLDTHTPSN